MDAFLRISAIFIVAIKRLFSQRRLALLTALGLTVAVALTLSVPLYADAVYYRVLQRALVEEPWGSETITRPPFAFMFRHIGSWYGPQKWDAIWPLDQYLSTQAGADLGLPQKLLVRFFKTDNLGLFPSNTNTAYLTPQRSLAWVSIGAISDFESHVILKEGRFPIAATGPVGETVEVLLSDELAAKLGLHAGETYITYGERLGLNGKPVQIPVQITGLWQPRDERDNYWFYTPTGLADVLLMPESSLVTQVSPRLEAPVNMALWYLVMDGSGVRSSDARPLLGRITYVQQKVSGLLANANLDISPVEALLRYDQAAALLTILLYAFSVPIMGLILAFIGLVVGLTVGQQRNEIAVLRSRGATAVQVVGIAGLEALVLGALALALGWPVGETFAQTIGRARSFLNFEVPLLWGSTTAPLSIQMTLPILRFGLVSAGIALVTQMVPTLAAARHTIITYKQERARTLRPPWWQRAWLDLALLIPAAYGIYMLQRQGSIAAVPLPGVKDAAANDPFQNPLLFLIPALGVFALTLFLLRVLPILMAAIVWLAGRTRSVGLLMATRHLARTPGQYTAPLVLLVLTLSLSAFTASLAQTLDNHLYDATFYQVGGDMQVEEMGESTQGADMGGLFDSSQTGSGSGAGAAAKKDEGPRWLFLPVAEYLKVPGVQAAARVGRYPAEVNLGGNRNEGFFIGVDRLDFAAVAFWRRDFAPTSLGSLMNALAAMPEGVLAQRKFMGQYALAVGDRVRVDVTLYGMSKELDLQIVGGFDLFPPWYPDDGPLFVGNLEHLFEQAGGQYPYSVWLKTDVCDNFSCRQADYERIVDGVHELGLNVIQWKASLRAIATEQRRPERQGLFGLLSVGFLAAALLTVIGFLLYALFSFRQRTIELGILRAIGLSASQMTSFLVWELIFLMLTGVAAGTGFGAWISHLFIPYLQVGSGPAARTPPFLVEIAWPAIFRIYALFGLLFVAALVVLVFLLLRMKIFQAIKLGETV
jgi:putative ABC transport system permease protein